MEIIFCNECTRIYRSVDKNNSFTMLKLEIVFFDLFQSHIGSFLARCTCRSISVWYTICRLHFYIDYIVCSYFAYLLASILSITTDQHVRIPRDEIYEACSDVRLVSLHAFVDHLRPSDHICTSVSIFPGNVHQSSLDHPDNLYSVHILHDYRKLLHLRFLLSF